MDIHLQKLDECVNFASESLTKNISIMKKFTSILAIMVMAAMSFTLVSCDDDDYIADTLWGVWEGDMQVRMDYHGHTYYAYETELAFDRNPYEYASGTGYWIDYYSGAPWDYYASHIEWNVYNNVIEIYSIEDDTYYRIYDYTLSDNYFTGWLESEWGDDIQFRLRKTYAPDWNDFDYGWYYDDGYYDPWYAPAQTRQGDAKAEKPVRKIGRIDK